MSTPRLLTVILSTLMFVSTAGHAQFTATLTGNPVSTTGWTYATGTTYVSGNEIVLTPGIGAKVGYIYYSTKQNLPMCGSFSASFEFKISDSSTPTADGLAFWYLEHPPSNFQSGGGIGLPYTMKGLVLVFDTYDNDLIPDNPIIALRGYNNQGYVEASPTGGLGTDLLNQSWVTHNTWNTCSLSYEHDTIRVFLNGATTPDIEAYYPINHAGYFGLSASTGSFWAKHAIRNVVVTGNNMVPLPTAPTPVVLCQHEAVQVPLQASGNNLSWYTQPSGTPLPGAPVPDTRKPGTTRYYVTQTLANGCESNPIPVDVIVNPKPARPRIGYGNHYCQGAPFVPFDAGGQQLVWYTTESGGVGDTAAPVISTDVAGMYQWSVSQIVAGCESDRIPVKVEVTEAAVADFDFTPELTCLINQVSFSNQSQHAQSYHWAFGDGKTSTEVHPVHRYDSQGVYEVRLIARGVKNCSDTMIRSVDTRHDIPTLQITVSADTSILLGESAQLMASGAESWVWSPAASLNNPYIAAPLASPGTSTTYTVIGTDDDGCTGSASVHVHVLDRPNSIPDAFTPNGDGRNDEFRILTTVPHKLHYFRVYNRWGQEVFQTDDITKGWDGTFQGIPQPVGTYFYVVQMERIGGEVFSIRGDVVLIR